MGRLHGNHARHPKSDSLKECERITAIGCGVDVALAIGKGVAGITGNSLALLADAVHSLSDTLSGIVTWITVKISNKPQDEDHQYGHGKFDSLGALGVSAILVATGGGIGWQAVSSVQSIWGGEIPAIPTTAALLTVAASLAVKEWLFRATKKVADRHQSSVMMANAWHHRSDAASSLVTLVGVGGAMLNIPIMDPLAAVVVAGLVMKAGIEVGWNSLLDLTDTSADPVLTGRIESILQSCKEDGLSSYHSLRTRRVGSQCMADVHIVVHPRLSVTASQQVAARVRRRVIEAVPNVQEIAVHICTGLGSPSSTSSSSSTSSPSSSSKLARPQSSVEQDVRAVLARPAFVRHVLGVAHFTCHFEGDKLDVQVEVVMDPHLTIAQASQVAQQLQREIVSSIPDVHAADVHLELSRADIERVAPTAAAEATSNTSETTNRT